MNDIRGSVLKKPWEKKVAQAQVSLTLKRYGLEVEKNRHTMVDADLTAFWGRTKKQYMFIVKESFSLDETGAENFKSAITFCKVNNIKLIVVAYADSDDLAGFTEDVRSANSMGFKLIRYDQLDQLYKDMLRVDTVVVT